MKTKKRTKSKYYLSSRESSRLIVQNKITKKFDEDVYNKVFNSYETPNILDIGCGNGDMLLDRLSDYQNDYKLIGLERESELVEQANKKYKKENILFIVSDVEQDDFIKDLDETMEQMGIDGFDVINISMLLLHLKSEKVLIRKLHQLLKPNGTIIIKDIDDGLNYAYPDDKHVFERIYKICDNNETSGVRRNGRQIYHDLYDAGFKNVSLEKSGLSTIGLSYEEKETVWEMYFALTLGDAEWMHEKYPDSLSIEDDYKWYLNIYDDLFNDFMKDDFVFSLGIQIYLAKK